MNGKPAVWGRVRQFARKVVWSKLWLGRMEASWPHAIYQGLVIKSACGTLGRKTTSIEALLVSVGSYPELLEINHIQCLRTYVLMQPVGLDKLVR
jgi:hypothetical protein